MEEFWKPIPFYDGLYVVSNTGKVKSLNWNHTGKPKELKSYDNGGYRRVCISKNGTVKRFLVHRLVAELFLDNPNNYPVVNHKDGNKTNNNVSNLEWISIKDNVNHAIETGLRPRNINCVRKRGRESKLCKPVYQYDKNNNLIRKWNSSFDIEEEFGYDRKTIISCCNGYKPTYRGFIWSHYLIDAKNK